MGEGRWGDAGGSSGGPTPRVGEGLGRTGALQGWREDARLCACLAGATGIQLDSGSLRGPGIS